MVLFLENLQSLFSGIIESCHVNTEEIYENQNKLLTVLNKIYEELETIKKVEKIEKKYLKYHNIIQNMQDVSLQDQLKK